MNRRQVEEAVAELQKAMLMFDEYEEICISTESHTMVKVVVYNEGEVLTDQTLFVLPDVYKAWLFGIYPGEDDTVYHEPTRKLRIGKKGGHAE